ncbi:MAG: tetratricopeptide repeat protein, partial [Lachnospiraceae bacterium]|nr:tetratricopeptide repeat protein [Lachnospiraceae bacterium]
YAIDIYSSVLKAGEPDARLYNRRALCRMALKEYAEAITDLEAGLARKDPSASRTLLRNEVTAYEYSGDFTKAKEKMKEYLSLYPEDAEAQREEIFLSTRNEEPTE